MTIPLLVFAAGGVALADAGRVPAGGQIPGWWHEPLDRPAPGPARRTRRRPPASPRGPVGEALFDDSGAPALPAGVGVPAPDPHAAALDAFEASAVYQRMRAAAGRAVLPQATVRTGILIAAARAGMGAAPQITCQTLEGRRSGGSANLGRAESVGPVVEAVLHVLVQGARLLPRGRRRL